MVLNKKFKKDLVKPLAVSGVLAVSIVALSFFLRQPEQPQQAHASTNQHIARAVDQDTRVKRVEPTSNFGKEVELRAGKDASGDYYESYVKFDLSFIPANATVTSAKIKFYVIDATDNGPKLYQTSSTYKNTSTQWLESGLTWNNRPTLVGGAIGDAGKLSTKTWLEYNITSLVNTNKGKVYSFALLPDSTDVMRTSSKENGDNTKIPYAEIDFTTP